MWTDPPAALGSAKVLVNDLDLEVIRVLSESLSINTFDLGSTYCAEHAVKAAYGSQNSDNELSSSPEGECFHPNGLFAPDRLNNVEQVVIPWEVASIGASASALHVGTSSGDIIVVRVRAHALSSEQAYSLVVTGHFEASAVCCLCVLMFSSYLYRIVIFKNTECVCFDR